jgi:hypothetical protein
VTPVSGVAASCVSPVSGVATAGVTPVSGAATLVCPLFLAWFSDVAPVSGLAAFSVTPAATVVVSRVAPVSGAAAPGGAPVACEASSSVALTSGMAASDKTQPPWRFLKWPSLPPQSHHLSFCPVATNIDDSTLQIYLPHDDLDAQTDNFDSSCPS